MVRISSRGLIKDDGCHWYLHCSSGCGCVCCRYWWKEISFLLLRAPGHLCYHKELALAVLKQLLSLDTSRVSVSSTHYASFLCIISIIITALCSWIFRLGWRFEAVLYKHGFTRNSHRACWWWLYWRLKSSFGYFWEFASGLFGNCALIKAW